MRGLISMLVALACWPAAATAQLTATEETRLVAPTFEANIEDELGSSVDVSGSTIISGAPGRDGSTTLEDAGAAYVWVGASRRQLLPATRRVDARFGESVAVDGTTAVVGAPFESYGGTGTEEGAVYVFGLSGSEWAQTQRIVATGAAAGDNFGEAVAIEGTTLVIGVPGRTTRQGVVYVYTRSGATWTSTATLMAPVGDRASSRGFGTAVALSGDVLVVGNYNYFNTATESAHVFERTGTTWAHVATLQASDGTVGNYYGIAVAVDGDRIAVGAPANATTGAVYLYERTAGTWSPTQKLTRSGTTWFGGAVAIDGDLALIGASRTSTNAGRAYAFLRAAATGTWSYATQSPAAAPSAGDLYGGAVALDGRRAAIGASREDVEMTTAGWDDGAVFPVSYGLANGAACSDRSAALCTSTFCTDGVCCATACAGACDACSVAAGATANGTCSLTPGVECRAATDACDVAEMCGATSACPDDVRMTDCSLDAGPIEVDAGPVEEDAGMTADAGMMLEDAGGMVEDAGSRDSGVDASSGTVPRRTLSCTCRAGLGGGSAPGSIAALLAVLALAVARRRR